MGVPHGTTIYGSPYVLIGSGFMEGDPLFLCLQGVWMNLYWANQKFPNKYENKSVAEDIKLTCYSWLLAALFTMNHLNAGWKYNGPPVDPIHVIGSSYITLHYLSIPHLKLPCLTYNKITLQTLLTLH